MAAPLLPLVTEHVHTGLTGDGASVHLADWPDAEQFPFDADLHAGMAQVRDACSTLLSLRKAEGLRVRLPLAKAVVATADTALVAPHLDILSDELNVKEVELTTETDRYGTKELILNPKTLGPRLGGRTQEVIKAHKTGDWRIEGDVAIVGGVELHAGEFDFRVVSAGDGAVATLKSSDGLVVLDTTVTPELEVEGRARDLIRTIQQARRDAGLDVSDRIRLEVRGPADVVEAFEAHRELVSGETLAVETDAAVADGDVVSHRDTRGDGLSRWGGCTCASSRGRAVPRSPAGSGSTRRSPSRPRPSKGRRTTPSWRSSPVRSGCASATSGSSGERHRAPNASTWPGSPTTSSRLASWSSTRDAGRDRAVGGRRA